MLTEKELEILNIIIDFIDDNGYAPSVREVCKITKLKSTSSVHTYFKSLQEKGFIQRKENFPRALRVIKKA